MYYNTHCVQCGNVIQTDELAFDFRTAIQKYAENILAPLDDMQEEGWRQDWRTVIGDLKLPILLNMLTLQRGFGLFRSETAKEDTIILYMKNIKSIICSYLGIMDWTEGGTSKTETVRKLRLKFMIDIPTETWESLCKLMEDYPDEVILNGTIIRTISENDLGFKYTTRFRIQFEDHSFVNIQTASCESCGNPLLPQAGEHEEIVIGMIGSGRVGKTAYLAALIRCLKEGNAVGASMAGSSANFERKILAPYGKGAKISKTELTGDDIPLFSHKIHVGPKTYIFTFVDMPGEAFVTDENDEGQGREQAYDVVRKRQVLKNARAFWFCLDPSQLEQDLSAFRQDEHADRVIVDLPQVITESLETYRQIQTVSTRIPAAVMITKCDMLSDLDVFRPEEERTNQVEARYLFGNSDTAILGSDLSKDTPEFWVAESSYDTDPFREEYVDRCAKQLTNELSPYFKINYFPVAAYGHDVDPECPVPPTPSGIRHPFYWTLAALGLICPVRKEERTRTVTHGLFIKKRESITEVVKVDADPNLLFCNPDR